MSKRAVKRAAQEYERWAAPVAQMAFRNARRLTLDLASGQPTYFQLYDMGVVLDEGEVVYQTVPAAESWETDLMHTESQYPAHHGGRGGSWEVSRRVWQSSPMTNWAITSARLVSRDLAGVLTSLYWSSCTGIVVDLAAGRVQLDCTDGRRRAFTSPAVAPIAVAAVAHLHGLAALVDHPALAPLRAPAPRFAAPRQPVAAIENPPVEDPLDAFLSV